MAGSAGLPGAEDGLTHPFAQCGQGFLVPFCQPHLHADMGRADTEIEGSVVEFGDRLVALARRRRAKCDFAHVVVVVDQSEGRSAGQIADIERTTRCRDRQRRKIDREARFVGIVLELADSAPGSDAPTVGRLRRDAAG